MNKEYYKLSDEATGAIMMALQKVILEKREITPLLEDLKFYEEGGKLFIKNPPKFKIQTDEDGQVDLGSSDSDSDGDEEEFDFDA